MFSKSCDLVIITVIWTKVHVNFSIQNQNLTLMERTLYR